MSLISDLQNAVGRYGMQGEKSLEYIGLLIDQGRFIGTKIYRKGENALTDFYWKIPYSIAAAMLANFYSSNGIKVCDISESVYRGQKSFRVSFFVPQMITQEETEKIIYDYFEAVGFNGVCIGLKKDYTDICRTLNIEYSPLMQLGAEFDENGSFLAVKYYLSVKQILDRKTVFNNDLTALLDKWKFPHKKIETLCANGYYPIFIGVNADETFTEYKLYFISEYLSRKTDIRQKMKCLFSNMEWYFMNGSDIDKIIDMGLFAEGIALSANDVSRERIYLNFVPKNISVKI